MTKEAIFEWFENHIYHISSHFSYATREQFEDLLRDNLFPIDFSLDAGITKAVLVLKDADYVIKIPFFCIYDEAEFDAVWSDWDDRRQEAIDAALNQYIHDTNGEKFFLTNEEVKDIKKQFALQNPEPDCSSDEFYFPLTQANHLNIDHAEEDLADWDYCEAELALYQCAKREGLAAYFAEEGCLGVIENTPIYYQIRCTPMDTIDQDYHSKQYTEKKERSTKICNQLQTGCFSYVWIADFIDMYGEEEFKRLIAFLDKYEIGDLRECNIGYLNNAPILFDYAGCRD